MRFSFHRQGADVRGARDIAEVIARGGLGYSVAKVPAAAMLADGTVRKIDRTFATVREDNGKPLGVVGSRYAVVQNADAFGFLDGAFRAGELTPERAGTFDGGARAWVLSRFNGSSEPLPGDKVDTHLVAITGHDGTTSVTVMPVTIRQVCTNGLTVCIGNKSLELNIRHGQSAQQRIDRFGQVLARVAGQVNGFFDVLQRLAAVSLPETAVRDYFQRVFPPPAKQAEPVATDGASLLDSIIAGHGDRAQLGAELASAGADHNARILEMVMANYHADRARGTAWGALNAVTEYTSHQMGSRGGQEGRMQSLLMGQGARINEIALAAAVELLN
jgi:phage/plasmid-like protein (TIGR03299 family)